MCISKKWSFRTSPNLSEIMKQEKTVEKKLSRAAIETLAIIVYHQPVTRAEIEEIRGVAFGTNTLEILMELNWVKPGGRKDVPGKPIQYVTTDDFLSHSIFKSYPIYQLLMNWVPLVLSIVQILIMQFLELVNFIKRNKMVKKRIFIRILMKC